MTYIETLKQKRRLLDTLNIKQIVILSLISFWLPMGFDMMLSFYVPKIPLTIVLTGLYIGIYLGPGLDFVSTRFNRPQRGRKGYKLNLKKRTL